MPNPSNTSTWANILGASRSPGHRKFVLFALLTAAGLCAAAHRALGQSPAAPAAMPPAFSMADLRPALANLQNAITAINIGHWKVPGDVRANTQQDVASVQKDLATTLPGLMTAADASPSANGAPPLAPTFAVFRNLDALYDVMLRVTETASVGAPAGDANSLESARAGLEDGRRRLGAWLLQAISAQDAKVAEAAAAANHPAAAPAAPTKIVVEDGPENPKPRKKKPATPPAPQ